MAKKRRDPLRRFIVGNKHVKKVFLPLPTSGATPTPKPLKTIKVPSLAMARPQAVPSQPQQQKPKTYPLSADSDPELMARYAAWRSVFFGALPAFVCWEWLTLVKGLEPYNDFQYQWFAFSGQTPWGSYGVDFFFPFRRLGWRLRSLTKGLIRVEDTAKETLAKLTVERNGMTLIDVWDDDITNRRDYVLEQAYNGREISHGERA